MALSVSACVTSPATTVRRDAFTVGYGDILNVDSFNGRVEIMAGQDNSVTIQATLRAPGSLDYQATQNGNLVTISAVKTGWWLFSSQAKADIKVTVPAGMALNLKTSNGGIDVSGTVLGGVLRTSNGSITLKDVKGSFDGSTSNGSVEVTAMEGSGLFKTSNGRIDIKGHVGDCNSSTSNGSITFSGEMKAGGQNRLTTSNGSVTVQLKGTPSVSLNASTSNGKVTCDLPILATSTGNNSLAGKIGNGDAGLFIHTSNSSITIR